MDRDDPKADGEAVESCLDIDDADADELALTRAVLQALRGWMLEGQTVVITRDTVTQEVRIDAFDSPDRTSAKARPDDDDLTEFAADDALPSYRARAQPCPGPGPSISATGSRCSVHKRKRRIG